MIDSHGVSYYLKEYEFEKRYLYIEIEKRERLIEMILRTCYLTNRFFFLVNVTNLQCDRL